jgi:hypothetical protein
MMHRVNIRVTGYCSLTPGEIRLRIQESGSLAQLAALPGSYVITVEDRERVDIITSESFAGQYFFATTSEGIFHGPSVGPVFRASGISWRWNFRALADYISLGHVIGSETLLSGVQRTSRGTILSWRNGNLESARTVPKSCRATAGGSAKRAIDFLLEDVGRWWSEEAVLCMTGGLDSRLLLAVMLAQGIRPELFVVGQAGSFDVEVAEAISRRFGLPLRQEEIRAEDFLENAAKIAAATSGMLPLSHWPGVLIAAKAPEATLFLGLNGEYARSYYFDRGIVSWVLDRLPVEIVGPWQWNPRLSFPVDSSKRDCLHPALTDEFTTSGTSKRLKHLLNDKIGFGPSLDEVYLNHYGANKTGADLSAIGGYRRYVVPFFSHGWIEAIRGLSRGWKLDSRFHRYAIGTLCPDLLTFPEVRAGRRMSNTAPRPKLFYWLARQRNEVKHFFNQSIYGDKRIFEFVEPYLAAIGDIVDPSLLKMARNDLGSRQLFFSLATVAIWRSELMASRSKVC